MNENPSGKLFKEPAEWPLIPPWWLLPSTSAAALLNIKPATLNTWRIRGQGPRPYPPMYFKPTQGRPLYYQYAALRSWAASRFGMAYGFEDQCMDFFAEVLPDLAKCGMGVNGCIRSFESYFQDELRDLLRGKTPIRIKAEHIHQLDIYHSQQPRRTRKYTPHHDLYTPS